MSGIQPLTKAERKAARERADAYWARKQAEILQPLLAAVDRHRAGEIDVWALDRTIHIYHRHSQELYSFMTHWTRSSSDLAMLMRLIDDEEHGEGRFGWRPSTPAEEG